jgi:hypothetical protein
MKPSTIVLPDPDTLLASALFLMTHHAKTRCPLLTRMIAQQLGHLARHPSRNITPQLRRLCEKLAGQWSDTGEIASGKPAAIAAPENSALLH